MGVVITLTHPLTDDPVPVASEGAQAARLLADIEIARARSEIDEVLEKAGDPLAIEIHALRRALALLDLTLHTRQRSRR